MLRSWLKALRSKPVRSRVRTRLTLELLALEDRVVPATTSLSGTTVTVNLDTVYERLTVTATAADTIGFTSNAGITGGASFVGATAVAITDSTSGTSVAFADSAGVAYSAAFAVTLDNPSGSAAFGGTSDFADRTLTVTTNSGISVAADAAVRSSTGAITLSANQHPTYLYGRFVGVDVAGVVESATGAVTIFGQGGSGSENAIGVSIHGAAAAVRTTGSGAVSITGTGGTSSSSGSSVGSGSVGVSVNGATVSSGGGNVAITGTGAARSASTSLAGLYGIAILGGGRVMARGAGNATLIANGGAGNNLPPSYAIFGGGRVMARGAGNATLIANGGASNKLPPSYFAGLYAAGVGSEVSSESGSITVTATSMILDNTAAIRAGRAGGGGVTIVAATGHTITLGSAAVSSSILALPDSVLDRVFAGTLQIGSATGGAITLSADITRSAPTAVTLVSGGIIASAAGGGSFTGGGNLILEPGATGSFKALRTGPDFIASAVSFAAGTDLAIAVAGADADTGYTQLNVVGSVDLTGVDLVLSGSYVPVVGSAYTLVTATARTGNFNGLAEGATITFNGVSLHIHYTASSATLLAAPASGSSAPTIAITGAAAADVGST